MSWAAHDLEPYAFQKHLGLEMAFVPLLIGSYAPDIATKWFVYGVGIFGWHAKASDPVQFHRGWPGAGLTHSLLFGVVIGLIIWKGFGSKLWGVRSSSKPTTASGAGSPSTSASPDCWPCYGCCRWVAWTLWAHVLHDYPYDLAWGGPHWVNAAHP